jgi:peptidoglycan/LPS O-acetylase OafA/YrhL
MEIRPLTFTRFLAAIPIVFFHFAQNIYPFDHGYLRNFISVANLGVSYFFLLSGFILTVVYFDREFTIKEFLTARIARILPVYWIALILYILFFLAASPGILKWLEIVLSFSLLQAWFPKFALTLNTPGWSLSIEAFFYLLFPLIIFSFRKIALNRIILISILLWVINQVIYLLMLNQSGTEGSLVHNFLNYFPLNHLGTFLMGSATGLLLLKHNEQWNRVKWNWVFYIVIIFILIIYILPNPIRSFAHNGLLVPLWILLIISIAKNTSFISRIFNLPLLVILGDISYGIYILQKPLNFYFNQLTRPIEYLLPDLLKFFLYVIFLIIFSFLCFRFVETPLRKKIKGYFIKNN